LKAAADKASLQRQGSKVTNHSVRKTSIGRLLDVNAPETFVAQPSGHKNLQSLQSYKSANEHHQPPDQRQMSYILSGSNQSQNAQQKTAPPASNSGQLLMSSSQQSHSQLSLQHTINSLGVNNASFKWCFSWSEYQQYLWMPVSDLQWPSEVDPTREKATLCYRGRRRRLTFIANVTEIAASSPHVLKIQSQTRPIFGLAFKLFKGQTIVNTGQCAL